MDVSIVAAIGSFVVSERVIKAKTLVLFGLLCTVTYDLFIHSNDPVSLRVYRGPACIALSLIACAFCLRAWRRNGIACDELLFLPGTKYAETAKGSDSRHINIIEMLPLNLRQESTSSPTSSTTSKLIDASTLSPRNPIKTNSNLDSADICEEIGNSNSGSVAPYQESKSNDSTLLLNDTDAEIQSEIIPLTSLNQGTDLEHRKTVNWIWGNCRGRRGKKYGLPSNSATSNNINDNEKSKSPTSKKVSDQLKGIARFFSSSQETNEYAPSGPIVASAGIDLCMPVLFNFHLFMLASKASSNTSSSSSTEDDDDDRDIDQYSIPPQILPLIFLSILFVRMVIPLKARTRFWTTVHSVVSSPFYSVTFRDAFLSEISTSLVRPLQDICFAIFYYFASMYGIFTGKVSLEETGSQLTHNILLHNAVLPTCAVLPLLCRFLQTLRQAYEEQRRWPHLGNAFKYLTASLVISYGMTHSEEVRSPLWICSFVLCAFYQIWWDVLIDWELITISKEGTGGIFIPFIGRIHLRSKRLFKSNKSYWRIIILNAMFRFTWMLSFIPAYHLSTSTGEMKNTFSKDIKSVVGFVVSLAELVRRSAWCILKLELETIKLTDEDYVSGTQYSLPSSRIQYPWFAPNERIDDALITQSPPPRANFISMKRAAYRLLVKKLFILELTVWVALYIGLGIVVSIFL